MAVVSSCARLLKLHLACKEVKQKARPLQDEAEVIQKSSIKGSGEGMRRESERQRRLKVPPRQPPRQAGPAAS